MKVPETETSGKDGSHLHHVQVGVCLSCSPIVEAQQVSNSLVLSTFKSALKFPTPFGV